VKQQAQVQEFHEAIGKKGPHLRLIARRPGMWDIEDRRALIEEEFDELMEAMDAGDMAEAVDAIMDLMYVLLGTLVRWGVPCEPFFSEVHRTNMAKVLGGSFNNVRKFIKPEGWQPPRIAEMLVELGVKKLTGWVEVIRHDSEPSRGEE